MEDEAVTILGNWNAGIGRGRENRGAFVQAWDVLQDVLVRYGQLERCDVDWLA